MEKVIATDWSMSDRRKSHYSLDSNHKRQLEKLFSMKIISRDEIKKDQKVIFYWGNKFTTDLLKSLVDLEWIHLGSSGTDNINLDKITKKNIAVSTSRGLFSRHVAEYILGIITFSSKFSLDSLFEPHLNSRAYLEESQNFPKLFGNQNILIVGTGVIAMELVKLTSYLSIKAQSVSISGRPGFKSLETLEAGQTYSHVVALLPYLEETKNFFSYDFFKSFCNGSTFINAGRGQTVDLVALVEAIDNNVLKQAYLDTHPVFSGSCVNLEYCKNPRIFCSPHIASWSSNFSEIQFNFLRKKGVQLR